MNPNQITDLILQYSEKKDSWEDATAKIAWYSQEEHCVKVRYHQSNIFYPISYSKIKIIHGGVILDPQKIWIYYEGRRVIDVEQIVRFPNHYRIRAHDGTTILYSEKELTVAKSPAEIRQAWVRRFNYYIDLADILRGEGEGFLADQYDSVNVEGDTVFRAYLNGSAVMTKVPPGFLCYPFGANLSQIEAVRKAFTNKVSVIEGPPGTGKTQTILNILANAIIQGKTVALVSSNNSAITNVKEKMTREGLGFLCALLGNVENKVGFFESLPDVREAVKDLSFVNQKETLESAKAQIAAYNERLPRLFELENRLAKLRIERMEVETERIHFRLEQMTEKAILIPSRAFAKMTSERLRNFRSAILDKPRLTWFYRVLIFFNFHVLIDKDTSLHPNALLNQIDAAFYDRRLAEIAAEMTAIEADLAHQNYDNVQRENRFLSMDYFKMSIKARYNRITPEVFDYESYRYHFDAFIRQYPVVLSTTFALLPSASRKFMFDYVIVDEASQTDLLSSVLSMSCTKNLIVVGDAKQLPQIEQSTLLKRNDELLRRYGIEKQYDYFGNNILTSVLGVFSGCPRTLLKEHYRCQPRIIQFCNQQFYDNQLVIMTKEQPDDEPLSIIRTVPGNHARKNPDGSGIYNLREIDEIVKLLKQTQYRHVAVITPFRKQADEIALSLKENGLTADADTVHKFQGRERDMVVLSTVLNDIVADSSMMDYTVNFVCRKDLLNVAISRAAKKLCLVVSDQVYQSNDNPIADLIKYIRYHGGEHHTVEGSAVSVFDILYRVNRDKLDESRRTEPREGGFDTETIVYRLICDILHDHPSLEVLPHYPLNRLIKNRRGFTDEEIRYLSHPWSHIDFLIYHKLGKEPVLAIEVDGVRFHEQNPIQSLRDEIKDRALTQNGIRFIRLRTNESDERARIQSGLRD